MPTALQNQANITYSFVGAAAPAAAASNITTTTLLDAYSLSAAKTALLGSFRPGENVGYVVTAQNDGQSPLYNLTVSDDLGAGELAAAPLAYVPDSVRAYIDGVAAAATTAVTGGALQITLAGPIAPGSNVVIVYLATASGDVSITNTAQVTAAGGSPTGATVAADPAPAATIDPADYASVTILKEASRTIVAAGETLSYLFTLSNSGNQAATDVVLTDALPEGFSVTQISMTAGGATTVFDPTDYALSTQGVLTLPAPAAAVSIAVPAATPAGDGVTTITVDGTITV